MNLKALRAFRLIVERGIAIRGINGARPQPARCQPADRDDGGGTGPLRSTSKRALRMTEKGSAFYTATRHLLAGMEEIPLIAKDIQTSDKQLKILTTQRIAQGVISPAVARMCENNPPPAHPHRCSVRSISIIWSGCGASICSGLSARHACPCRDREQSIVSRPARSRDDAAHPLAARNSITASDLAGEDLVGPWADQLWRQQMNDSTPISRSVRHVRRRDAILADGVSDGRRRRRRRRL